MTVIEERHPRICCHEMKENVGAFVYEDNMFCIDSGEGSIALADIHCCPYCGKKLELEEAEK